MSSQFLCQRLSDFFDWDYSKSRAALVFKPKVPKEHTYCLVFGMYNDQELTLFKEQKCIKILYESPYAINTHHGGTKNQQKIIVFEFQE